MTFPTKGRFAVAFLFALAVGSCDQAPIPTGVDAGYAGEPQQLLGLDALLSGATKVTAVDQYGVVRQYELLRRPLLSLGDVSLSELIGADGGSLELLGHRIVVPAGAVDVPTLFTLTALSTGYVQVDIAALAPGMSGLLDVGADGFDRPVRLDMSYAEATNLKRNSTPVILRLNPGGMDEVHEALPTTIDARRERGTVWLEHFSGYAMAM